MFSAASLDELVALHRALYTARLEGPSDQIELATSPVLADIHRRIVEALIEAVSTPEEARTLWGTASDWHEWLDLGRNATAYAAVERRLEQLSGWPKASEAKEGIVRALVSPFDASEDQVRSLVQHGDAVHRA